MHIFINVVIIIFVHNYAHNNHCYIIIALSCTGSCGVFGRLAYSDKNIVIIYQYLQSILYIAKAKNKTLKKNYAKPVETEIHHFQHSEIRTVFLTRIIIIIFHFYINLILFIYLLLYI